MGLPVVLRNGGHWIGGTVFEVYQKTEGYRGNEGWVRSEHWVLEVRKIEIVRGKERELPNYIYLSADQVKRKVHEKLKALEGTYAMFAVYSGNYNRMMLVGDDALSLAE